ncbi:MAG: EAL domain-containing protein [Chloroflexota bacterium]
MAHAPHADPGNELLSLSEAASIARVHRETMRSWCQRGRLPSVPGPRRGQRRVRRADVERVLAATQVQALGPTRDETTGPAMGGPFADPDPQGRAGRSDAVGVATHGREDSLRRLAAEVSGSQGLQAVYDDVLDTASRLFSTDHASIGLLGRDPRLGLDLVASRHISQEAADLARSLPVILRTAGGDSIPPDTVRVLASNDSAIDPRFQEVYRRAGIETACFVPMVFRGEPVGLIALYHDSPRTWTTEDVALARGYADGLATAVGNARLIDSVQSLAARLHAVQALAARINGLTDLNEIGEAIVAEVGSLIPFDTVRVYRVDAETNMCEPIAFRGVFMGSTAPTDDMLRCPIGTGLTGWVAEHGQSALIGDAQSDERSVIVGSPAGPEPMLVVPMSLEGRVHGVIVLSRLGHNLFDADDESTLTIFAGYAAQAIVNARRLEQLHEQRLEMEHQLAGQQRLIAVNERLLSTLDASSVLELVADSLKAVVDYDSLTIYRVDLTRNVRQAVIARDQFADEILEYAGPLGTGITGWAVEHREAVLANDAISDPRVVQIPGTPIEPESLIVVPLIVFDEVLGTLNVSRIGEGLFFTANEFELTKLFAAQAAIALRNADTHGEIKVQAEQDALTGLRNHGSFQREMALAIEDMRAQPLALLMMDLDRFKAYNDALGHPAGDELLVAVSRAIEAAIRSGDTAYRYGGDEFVVILRHADRVGAEEVAQRIKAAIDGLHDERSGPLVSISVGLACLPDDGSTKDELIEAADSAMYVMKGSRSPSVQRDPLAAALDETAGALLRGGSTTDLLNSILGRAGKLLGTSHAYLSIVEPTGTHLEMRAGLGLYERHVGQSMSIDIGVAGVVTRTGRPFRVDDYAAFEHRAPQMGDALIGAVVGVPLMARGGVMGMIGVASGSTQRTWGEPDVHALRRFGQLASIALENARLQEAALRGPTDPVTGLPTRERLVDAVDGALRTRMREGGAAPFSVLLLDIDRFKVINEGLGHEAGDQVLAEVGRRIATVLGPMDLVARFGGDEFGILLGGADETRASLVADAVLANLRAPMDLDGRLWFISASVGFVVSRPGHSTAGSVLREAVVALVQAQAESTTRIGRFDEVNSQPALERFSLETELRAAIERDELVVDYQPIVDLQTERITGFEALVRWQHPTRGLIPPLAFIPLAEEANLIIPLGAVVLGKACRQIRAWRDRWPTEDLVMSVNLSPHQFADPHLVASIAQTLAETGLESSALELEITETAVMDRSAAGVQALSDLRGLGVRLVLDDFGTGYSSLAHLRYLPLDTMKVDRLFVTDLDDDDPNVAIVQAVLSLAHGLGLTVVAEGIERAEQAARLRELGCDLGQGYFWSKPVNAAQIEQLMARAIA